MEHKIYETELAGRKLSFEFGRYAEQAAGSVLVRYGDTVVLVCATVADTPRPGIDFFPLSVDFLFYRKGFYLDWISLYR